MQTPPDLAEESAADDGPLEGAEDLEEDGVHADEDLPEEVDLEPLDVALHREGEDHLPLSRAEDLEQEGDELDEDEDRGQELEPLDGELRREGEDHPPPSHDDRSPSPIQPDPPTGSAKPGPPAPLYDDPSDDDDGEGEWITPSNVSLHTSRALDLLPASGPAKGKRNGKADEPISAGCMTADFAMQNVLLQMGLSLVGVEGKRIERVKTWVLRCHACFKCALSPCRTARTAH